MLANRDNSLAKIGLTRNGKPDTRADDYAREHGIQWRVYWSAVTCNVAEAEARAHRELADFRFATVPGAREIFHVTPVKAQRVVERYVVAPKTEAQLAYDQAERERQQREAEAAQTAARTQREAAQKVEATRSAQAAVTLKGRTLTALYNMRGTPEGTWLDNLHRTLDDAVAAAYGWTVDISIDDALARLLALNRARRPRMTPTGCNDHGHDAVTEAFPCLPPAGGA